MGFSLAAVVFFAAYAIEVIILKTQGNAVRFGFFTMGFSLTGAAEIHRLTLHPDWGCSPLICFSGMSNSKDLAKSMGINEQPLSTQKKLLKEPPVLYIEDDLRYRILLRRIPFLQL